MSRKVTIIGAGSVGSTIAYTMAVNGLAGEVVMIDINTSKALGEAMDTARARRSARRSRSTPAPMPTRKAPTW